MLEELSLFAYLGIFILIAFSGFIDSIAGGGGLISIPTYMIFGVPAEFILGTNKTVSTSGTTIAVSRYILNGKIDWKTVGYAIIAALIGSQIGASYSHILSKETMTLILIFIVPFIFILNLKLSGNKRQESEVSSLVLKSVLIGFFIGGYDGFFGPGTGTFLIFSFVTILHWDFGKASANARIINYASNLSAFVYFLFNGNILWEVVVIGLLGSFLGNWIGSGLVVKLSEKIVKPIFNTVLIMLLIKCIYDVFI